MTLLNLRPNNDTQVSKINLPWKIRKNLMELSIIPKAKIKFINKNNIGGIILVQIGQTHVALDKEIAKKIEINRID